MQTNISGVHTGFENTNFEKDKNQRDAYAAFESSSSISVQGK